MLTKDDVEDFSRQESVHESCASVDKTTLGVKAGTAFGPHPPPRNRDVANALTRLQKRRQ